MKRHKGETTFCLSYPDNKHPPVTTPGAGHGHGAAAQAQGCAGERRPPGSPEAHPEGQGLGRHVCLLYCFGIDGMCICMIRA